MKRLFTKILLSVFCIQLVMAGFPSMAVQAAEPLLNIIENGDMEGDVNNWKSAGSVTGAVITLEEDTEDPTNHVLRYDGTGITAGSISYVAYNGILTVGQEYYFSYKIRMADCDTNTGDLYAYNQNHVGQNVTDRPKLSKEWVSRSGVFVAKATSYNFKITSSYTSSSANVAKAVYELDDVVICEVPFGDVLTVSGDSELNGTTIQWKSGVIGLDGDLYARADSVATFELTSGTYEEIVSVEVNGEVIAPDSEGVYEITIPDDLQLVINVDVKADNVPKLLSVSPENVMNADPEYMEIEATFDRAMNVDSLESDITVAPEADFDVVPAGGFAYKLIFENLENATEYTVTFDGLLSVDEVAMETPYTYTFSTASPCINMIENGDMSDTSRLDMFVDNNNTVNLSYVDVEDNSVLRWKVTYSNAPLIQYTNNDIRTEKFDLIGGHTYYVKARVKAEKETKISWSVIYTTDSDQTTTTHSKYEESIEAGQWTVFQNVFTVPANINLVKNHGVRLGASIYPNTIYVDDMELIDCSITPGGKPEMVSCVPENGASEVEVGNGELEASITFDKSLLPTKVNTSNITVDGATIKDISMSADKKTCFISLSELKVNTRVEISYKNLTSMAGEDVDSGSVYFDTKTVSTAAPVIVEYTPANEGKVGLSNLTNVKVVYDLPLEGPIDKDNFTTVPENLIDQVEWSDNSNVINIKLNQALLSAGSTYSITLLPSIKSLAGTPINQETLTFVTITAEEIVQEFKAILEKATDADANEVLDFVVLYYNDLVPNDTLCKNMLEKDSEIAEEFAKQIIEEGIGQSADSEDVMEFIRANAILTIVNHSQNEELIADTVNSILSTDDMTALSDTYDTLSDEIKAEICGDIKDLTNDFRTNQDFTDYLEETIIFTALKKANGWKAISDILNGNIEFLSNETQTLIKKINNSKNKAEIYLSLQGKNVSTEDDIYDSLKDAYTDKSNESTKPSGSGGGGGGGGKVAYSSGNNAEAPSVKEEEAPVFKDIDSVPWAKEAIEHFYELKVITGKTADTFCPNDFVTREEFVKMIVVAADIPMAEKNYKYADVNQNAWYYPYVSAATEAKLVQGVDGSNFGIGQSITRQDIATICNRLLGASEDDEESEESADLIADFDEVSEYAKDAVERFVGLGIIKGDEDGNFAPRKNATRAETAVLLQRLIAFRNSEGR